MGKFIEGQVWSDLSTWKSVEDLSPEDRERDMYWGLTATEWAVAEEVGPLHVGGGATWDPGAVEEEADVQ